MKDRESCSNRSENPTLIDVAERRGLSRRSVLSGGLATAAIFAAGGGAAAGMATTVFATRPARAETGTPLESPELFNQLGFRPIAPSTADTVVVPPGYTATPFLPWGTPLFANVPDWELSQGWQIQEKQVGMNHDGMWFFPTWGNDDGIIVINHEYTDDEGLFPDGVENWTHDKTLKSQAAHGLTVARIKKVGGEWQLQRSGYNRRVTAYTPCDISGPAAGHPLLQSKVDGALDPVQARLDSTGTRVYGTINNCAMGYTPWGTYLTCEENFHGYFTGLGDAGQGQYDDKILAGFDRYGIEGDGFYQWALTDPRWRANEYPNEPNKFGWVVEIDPLRPWAAPVKRTALGRLKHEGAWVTMTAEGRPVVYMGDDERGEYVYKFVSDYVPEGGPLELRTADQSSRRLRPSAGGQHPLDAGTLYVARFGDDGTGEWMPLVHGHGPLTAENGWNDQAEVLVFARGAADALGATKMDRPEWGTVDPVTGHVYMTMTNNRERGVEPDQPLNRANPRPENPWGHIVRWKELGDFDSTTFIWDIFLLAGPGNGVDGSDIDADDAFGSPDGLWMDPQRRLWIQTDGAQPIECNDQMLAADPISNDIRRFLVGPNECEITGITVTPDQTTMWINVQHPGDHNPELSTWPFGGYPRAASVIITKDDGGIIGT